MDLESGLLQSVCRTCLSKSNHMKNILHVADIIMSCASIQVEPGDGLPSAICSDCVVLAKKAHGFRLLCEHSDNVLREILRKNNRATIKIEKCDFNSTEIQSDANGSTYDKTEPLETNDSYLEINDINEIHETDNSDIDESSSFEIYKVEISETDDYKEFQAYNNETLGTNQTSIKVEDFQDNESDLQATTNNVNKEKSCTNDKKNSKVSNSVSKRARRSSKMGFPCQYCGQKFLLKRNLHWHEKNHGDGLKCDVCGKNFQNLKKFRNHVSVHKRKGAYACPTCGKQFTFPENLKVHERIHTGAKPYNCRFCTKSFAQWSERKSHEVVHTSEKAYLCSICGTKFARSYGLLRHTRRVHFNPSEHVSYVCTVCDKKFKVHRDLAKHMYCHSEKRNFVCKVCNKGFKHKQNLRLHEKIHTGVKPHVCPVCQRAFLQKQVLTSHLRTHAP